MLETVVVGVQIGFLLSTFFSALRKEFVRLLAAKYKFKLVVVERILDAIPISERRE